MIAYLAEKVRPGKVQLFKLMFLADFTAKAERGRAITGEMYENFEMGPVPQTLWRRFKHLVEECAVLEKVDSGLPLPQQRISPLAGYARQLDPDEFSLLDRIIEKYGKMSGSQLRDYTHETLPYRATERGDVIPYGLAGYLDYQKPTPEEVRKAVWENPERLTELRAALQSGQGSRL